MICRDRLGTNAKEKPDEKSTQRRRRRRRSSRTVY
jgi:hypothetical protein